MKISYVALVFIFPFLAHAGAGSVQTELPVQRVPAADHNRGSRLPNVLVLHYTQCSLAEAFDFFQHGHVSAHYTIDRSGEIYQHVDELEAAHHAGVSYWRRASVNQSSIGIEIVNSGYMGRCDALKEGAEGVYCAGELQWEVFAESQVQSVLALCQGILSRYSIDPFDVVGHADVAPQRKEDPGPAFPWLRLARSGIGVAYDPDLGALVHGQEQFSVHAVRRPSLCEVQRQLASMGYAVPQHGEFDAATTRVLLAFNSHYLSRYDSELSEETLAVLDALGRWRQDRQTAASVADAAQNGRLP
jgi:N-acetylmuramoyl-L-alanine amidase